MTKSTRTGPFLLQAGGDFKTASGAGTGKINLNRFRFLIKFLIHQESDPLFFKHRIVFKRFVQNQSQTVTTSGFHHGQADLLPTPHLLHHIGEKTDCIIRNFQHLILLLTGWSFRRKL